MQRKEYTVSELIENPSFQRMVQGRASSDEISRWNLWIEESDQHRAKAKQAIAEIAGFEFADPAQPDMQEEWRWLYDATIGESHSKIQYIPPRVSSMQWIYRVAAILLLGGIVGMGLYLYPESDQTSTQIEQITQERTVRTDSGEQKTIKFSNGSKIILNSNAVVSYNLGLLHNQTIEVTLEGEAYFDAESDPTQTKPIFAVKTPDGTIRDIGTEFLVTVQSDRSRVVLQEGKVEIKTKNKADSNQRIAIQEGEMLEFNELDIISKQVVNATFYTAWATDTMQFDETTIQEFAGFLEQRFEVEVQVVDPELADIKLDGGVYFQSLAELVRSVSEIAKIPVYQSEDRKTVYIGDIANEMKNHQ